jgi:hypothetical protein
MPDLNIKKNIVLKQNLPNLIGNNTDLKYEIRYRIVSEDKNRVSHWSPINSLISPTTSNEVGFDPANPSTTSIPHQVSVDKSGHVAQIVWTMPALLITNPTNEEKLLQAEQSSISEFDVYVSWLIDSVWTDWIWGGIATGRKYFISYSHPTDATKIKFRVQKVTQSKQPFNAATYLVSNGYAL